MPAPGRPDTVSRTWQVMKGRSAIGGDVVGVLLGKCDVIVLSLRVGFDEPDVFVWPSGMKMCLHSG